MIFGPHDLMPFVTAVLLITRIIVAAIVCSHTEGAPPRANNG